MRDKINGELSSYFLSHLHNPKIFPIIRSRRRKLISIIKDGEQILDIGARTKWVRDTIIKEKPSCGYKSMDIDRNQKHDYYSIDDIHEQFDVAIFFDVVEHLSMEQWLHYLEVLKQQLNAGGRIVISIPNLYYIGNIYHSTHEHIQDYSVRDLIETLKENYPQIEVFRLYPRPWSISTKLPVQIIRHCLRYIIAGAFDYADYAPDVVIIATKK